MRKPTTETTNDYRPVYVAGPGGDRPSRSGMGGMNKITRGFQLAIFATAAILFAIEGEWWTVSWIAVASLAVFEACMWKSAYENTQR